MKWCGSEEVDQHIVEDEDKTDPYTNIKQHTHKHKATHTQSYSKRHTNIKQKTHTHTNKEG